MEQQTIINTNSKIFYESFLERLVDGQVITPFCKNKLKDLLNSNKQKYVYAFKKYFNNLLELSDAIQR